MSLTNSPSHVSLQDSDASPEEIQLLRGWMLHDNPAFDECPELPEDAYEPSPEDQLWWSMQADRPAEPKLLEHVHVSPRLAVALVEVEHPTGDEFRYRLISYSGGCAVAEQGFDSLKDAKTLLWHMTRPLPDGPAPALTLSGSWSMPGEDREMPEWYEAESMDPRPDPT